MTEEKKLRVAYKVVDGVSIPTDVFIPPAVDSKHPRNLAPVIIMIHGGAFMLGSSGMNNKDQIEDCLERGWIVVALEHRLCPGINVLVGPIADARDALSWTQSGGLATALESGSEVIRPDPQRVMVMGTSSGGHLALCMGFGVPKQPLAILDFYGAKCFDDPFWTQPIPEMINHLPPPPTPHEVDQLREEKHKFIGGVSLEGQKQERQGVDSADLNKARLAFVLNTIASGKVIQEIWPPSPQDLHLVDPIFNISKSWPPTAIVHGTVDNMIPLRLSRRLEELLKEAGVETELIEVVDEPHTFAGKMVKGSKAWEMQRKGFDFLEKVLKSSYSS